MSLEYYKQTVEKLLENVRNNYLIRIKTFITDKCDSNQINFYNGFHTYFTLRVNPNDDAVDPQLEDEIIREMNDFERMTGTQFPMCQYVNGEWFGL